MQELEKKFKEDLKKEEDIFQRVRIIKVKYHCRKFI
jgi:hypothetical protein